MRKLLFLTLCVCYQFCYAQTQNENYLGKETLNKSVLLLADEEGTASGLLLNVNNEIYLVTTETISSQIAKGTKVYMTGNNSKFVELPFAAIIGNRDLKWKFSLNSDLAILKIASDTTKYFSTMKAHALDYTRIYHSHDTISKSTPITVFGHMLADTVKGTIAPTSADSKFSSGPISLMENNVRYSYYLLPLPAGVNRFIGSPVFASVKTNGTEKPVFPKTVLVGIINNYFLGGDSAQMIPASSLFELISN